MSQVQTLSQKLFNIQQRVKALVKDSNNPFFKSKYADLNQCLNLTKTECQTERLVIVQGPDVKEGIKGVRTAIIDIDTNQSIDCFVPYSGNEKNAQEIGAATTYNRRFGLVSLFALEQDDDDGETAVGRSQTTKNVQNDAASKPVATNRSRVEGVPEQPKTTVPKASSRKTINETISLTTKVLVDSKRMSQDEVVKMLTSFGVKTKEELNDDQAAKLLKQYEDKLNAK